MAKIGRGDISPDLFALPLADFLNSFTDKFKRSLLPDMSDKQIEKELTSFHKANNGTKPSGRKTKATPKRTDTDNGGSTE